MILTGALKGIWTGASSCGRDTTADAGAGGGGGGTLTARAGVGGVIGAGTVWVDCVEEGAVGGGAW